MTKEVYCHSCGELVYEVTGTQLTPVSGRIQIFNGEVSVQCFGKFCGGQGIYTYVVDRESFPRSVNGWREKVKVTD